VDRLNDLVHVHFCINFEILDRTVTNLPVMENRSPNFIPAPPVPDNHCMYNLNTPRVVANQLLDQPGVPNARHRCGRLSTRFIRGFPVCNYHVRHAITRGVTGTDFHWTPRVDGSRRASRRGLNPRNVRGRFGTQIYPGVPARIRSLDPEDTFPGDLPAEVFTLIGDAVPAHDWPTVLPEGADPESICTICLEKFDDENGATYFKATQDTCAHLFHPGCIVSYIIANSERVRPCDVNCPNCRSSIELTVKSEKALLFNGSTWPDGIPLSWHVFLATGYTSDDWRITSESNGPDLRSYSRMSSPPQSPPRPELHDDDVEVIYMTPPRVAPAHTEPAGYDFSMPRTPTRRAILPGYVEPATQNIPPATRNIPPSAGVLPVFTDIQMNELRGELCAIVDIDLTFILEQFTSAEGGAFRGRSSGSDSGSFPITYVGDLIAGTNGQGGTMRRNLIVSFSVEDLMQTMFRRRIE